VIGTHSTELWQQDKFGLITLITDNPNPDRNSVFPRTFSSQDDVQWADFGHVDGLESRPQRRRTQQAGSREMQEGNVEL
jgi:hypothetical protein